MGRRRLQDVIQNDTAYAGSFVVDRPVDAAPPRQPDPIQPRVEGLTGAPDTARPVRRTTAVSSEATAQDAKPAMQTTLPPRARKSRAEAGQRKALVSVRARPLAAQAERIASTGLHPRQVMKAAWRRAVEGYSVGPTYIEPGNSERAGGPANLWETTLTVDAEALEVLARRHDPLGVEGGWWLIRGQLEPAFWTALDEVLAQLTDAKGTAN